MASKEGEETKNTTSNSSSWKPYENALAEVPSLSIKEGCCTSSLMIAIYKIRWACSRPLGSYILPSSMPEALGDLHFVTLGQLILTAPLIGLLALGYLYTFIVPHNHNSGLMASYVLYIAYLTANKTNSIFTLVLGIPFERMIVFHNMASVISVILGGLHTYCAYYSTKEKRRNPHGLNSPDPNIFKYIFQDSNNTWGTLLLIAMTLSVLLSFFPIIRRKFFDFWLVTHILLALVTAAFCFLHGVTTIILVVVLAWWFGDVLMRYVYMAGVRYPSFAGLELVRDDVVKVTFPKPHGFKFKSGQFIQVAFPDITMLQFHPLSIASAPHEETITLYIRTMGGWSSEVIELAKSKNEDVRILLEGPYGEASMNIDDDEKYQMALCVSGGIGVTHTQSIAKGLLDDHKRGRQLKHLRFVWAVREMDMIKTMEPLEATASKIDTTAATTADGDIEMETQGSSNNNIVQTDIYLTQKSTDEVPSNDQGRNIHVGRPSMDAIVEEMRAEAEKLGLTNVAVFGCGPQSLITRLKFACKRASSSGKVQFDVHEEIYEF